MREKIMHYLLMVIVGLALAISLSRVPPPESRMTAAGLPSAPEPTLHPVAAYRQERKETRKQTLSMLEEIGERDEMIRIAARAEGEMAVEAALAQMGDPWGLCVAFEDSALIFCSISLTDAQAALILETAREILSLAPENIRISGC